MLCIAGSTTGISTLALQLFDSFNETLSVVTAYFPWPLNEEQKESIQHVRAISAGGLGLRAQHFAPMVDIPIRLWAAEPE